MGSDSLILRHFRLFLDLFSVKFLRLSSQFVSLSLLMLPLAPAPAVLAHGSHGGSDVELEAGEFDFSPIITIEGHGGFDTNLDGDPRHYAVDGLFGGSFSWGVGNGAACRLRRLSVPLWCGERLNISMERFIPMIMMSMLMKAMITTIMMITSTMTMTNMVMMIMIQRRRRVMMMTMLTSMNMNDEHQHEHAHSHDTDYQRTDVKGFLQVRYAPNDRLNVAVSWNPYYVTRDQGDDLQGLKNELGTKVTWALGDGDVNFGLGDGFGDLVDGVYLSVDHRQGWESDGMYVGNYTDPRAGLGFKFGSDEISFRVEAGPRFYVPGSYAGLDQRTDLAGEVELSVPVGDATWFLHWQQTYSWDDAPGWGEGWQHHLGTGVSFTF